jgi:hypothetical protein
MGRHTREYIWSTSKTAVIPGKVKGSFWRIPTDLGDYTPEMMFGMKLDSDGRIRAVTVQER